MKNEYEVRGDVTAIIVNSAKYGRFESLISTNKLERANEFIGSWYVSWAPSTKSFYVSGNVYVNGRGGKQTTVTLHRWITNVTKGKHVDHINHDTLNNTDNNLRICTNAENKQNMKGARLDNKTSGIRGVSWHKCKNNWRAQIGIKGKIIHIGSFDNLEEAEEAVKVARAKYMPYSQEASA